MYDTILQRAVLEQTGHLVDVSSSLVALYYSTLLARFLAVEVEHLR
jgi:hypothetical protein